MKIRKNKIKKKKWIKPETPFQLSMRLDLLGLALATIVVIASFYVVPSEGSIQWSLKSAELAGVGAAASAIVGIFHEFGLRKQAEKVKRRLQGQARVEGKPMCELLSDKIRESIDRVKEIADAFKMNLQCFFHSPSRATMDFTHNMIDCIDIQEQDYRITFLVRFHRPEFIEEIFHILPGARKKMVRIIDEHHVSPVKDFPMTEEGVRSLQTVLIMWVITPCHLMDCNMFA